MKTMALMRFMLMLFPLLWAQELQAQTHIKGIINNYEAVKSIDYCTPTITVKGNTDSFPIGGRVLLLQMKGATIDTSNTQNYGNITQPNNAGRYEFGTIVSKSAKTVTLSTPLLNFYDTNGTIQLVSVPVYTTPIVTVDSTLTCKPWYVAGQNGGVLVFEAPASKLVLNAHINVGGCGFKGGNGSAAGWNIGCPMNYYFPPGINAGEKGEGICARIINQENGRGKLANGGGGGNEVNAGGGGGGNGGAGGLGGNPFNGGGPICANNADSGLSLAPYSEGRVFLGGGGGGGHRNDNGPSNGVAGGGIIIILVNAIEGQNKQISSNGTAAPAVAGGGSSDGGGGGGAGGSILLLTQSFGTTPLTINAKGGNGANTDGANINAHGPGGGGGGGRIGTNTAFPANVTLTLNGGLAGKIFNGAGTQYGAENGKAGIITTGSQVLSGLVPDSVTICSGGSLALQAKGSDEFSYYWNGPGILTQSSQTLIIDPVWMNHQGSFVVSRVMPSCDTLRDTVYITVSECLDTNCHNDIANWQKYARCFDDSTVIVDNSISPQPYLRGSDLYIPGTHIVPPSVLNAGSATRYVGKMNANGNYQWGRDIGRYYQGSATCIQGAANGELLVSGLREQISPVNSKRYLTLLRMNSSGTAVLWSKEFAMPSAITNDYQNPGLTVLPNGNIVMLITDPGSDYMGIVLTNAAGTLLFNRFYRLRMLNTEANHLISTTNGGFLVTGTIGDNNGLNTAQDYVGPFLMQFSPSGTLLWHKTYRYPSASGTYDLNTPGNFDKSFTLGKAAVENASSGRYIVAAQTSNHGWHIGSTFTSGLVFEVNASNGTPFMSVRTQTPEYISYEGINRAANGDILVCGDIHMPSLNDTGLLMGRLNSSLGFMTHKKIPLTGYGKGKRIFEPIGAAGDLFITGQHSFNSRQVPLMLRTDMNGSNGCDVHVPAGEIYTDIEFYTYPMDFVSGCIEYPLPFDMTRVCGSYKDLCPPQPGITSVTSRLLPPSHSAPLTVAEGISIYPNPTSGTVQVHGLNPGNGIQLYNAIGQLLVRKIASGKNEQLNISHLANGVYTIIITGQDRYFTTKIIKR